MAEGAVDFQVFDNYERRRPDVDAVIGRLFLQRVSARRLRSVDMESFWSGGEKTDQTYGIPTDRRQLTPVAQ